MGVISKKKSGTKSGTGKKTQYLSLRKVYRKEAVKDDESLNFFQVIDKFGKFRETELRKAGYEIQVDKESGPVNFDFFAKDMDTGDYYQYNEAEKTKAIIGGYVTDLELRYNDLGDRKWYDILLTIEDDKTRYKVSVGPVFKGMNNDKGLTNVAFSMFANLIYAYEKHGKLGYIVLEPGYKVDNYAKIPKGSGFEYLRYRDAKEKYGKWDVDAIKADYPNAEINDFKEANINMANIFDFDGDPSVAFADRGFKEEYFCMWGVYPNHIPKPTKKVKDEEGDVIEKVNKAYRQAVDGEGWKDSDGEFHKSLLTKVLEAIEASKGGYFLVEDETAEENVPDSQEQEPKQENEPEKPKKMAASEVTAKPAEKSVPEPKGGNEVEEDDLPF